MSTPGTMPPTNSWPIETLPRNPYRISPMLGGMVAVISERHSFEGFLDWVVELRQMLDIPHTLGGLGVPLDELDRLAAMAAVDPCAAENPVRMGPAEMRRVLDAAVAGRL
jgi:alcohol dehydrogenase class IV